MARRDCSGAEKGSVIELDATSVSIVGGFASDTTKARSGTRAWHASLLAASLLDNAEGRMNVSGTAPTTYSIFFAFWIDPTNGLAVGQASINIFRLRHGPADGDIIGIFRWDNNAATGAFVVEASNLVTTQVVTFNSTKTGVWNLCQIRCTINTGLNATDNWSVRLNGVETSGPSINFATAGLSRFDFGILGQSGISVATDLDVFFDDIILDDASAAFQIPDASFLSFHEADGTVTNTWLLTAGAASAHAALTDDDILTRISSDTDAQICEVSLTGISGTLPSSGVLIVSVYGSYVGSKAAPAANGDIIMRYKEGTTNGANTTVTVDATQTTRRSSIVNSVKPTGGAWTQSAVNAASFYMESDIGTLEGVRVDEQWHYAEVQVKISLDDPITETDAIASINVDVSLVDPMALAEAVAIEVTASLDDALSLADDAAIRAEVSLDDALTLDDDEDVLIYLPGGASSTNIFGIFE